MTVLPAIAGADRATAHRYFDDFALRRRPSRRAAGKEPSPDRTSPPMPPA
ncbi:hypothetical protein ACFYPZ_32365 [Streptomyces sp. NPDC005506]